MKRKTNCIINVFITICVIAASFQSLYSRYTNRPTRPMTISPAPTAQPVSSSQPIIPSPEEEREEIQNKSEETKPATEPRLISDVKGAQIEIETPPAGWLANAYATMVPIILVTLDKAIGTGIAKSTKSVIEDFLTRKKFLSFKNDILFKTNEVLKPEFKNKSNIEKLEIGKELFLSEKETKSFDKLEKETSISSIFAQAAHIFVLNIVVNAMGTALGLVTKVGLSVLMPDQK